MTMSNIKKSELVETGFCGGTYKGFDVFVSLTRYGYEFKIGVFLEENSDAVHWIAKEENATTLKELVSDAKDIINNYEFTAKQFVDLHQVFDICNHDIDKSAAEFVVEAMEAQKQVEVRAMPRPVYEVLMTAYRLARSLVVYSIKNDPDNHRHYAKRLKRIDEQFEIAHLKPKGFDKYHPDYAFAWIIERAMNEMDLPASKASKLAEAFQKSATIRHGERTDYKQASERKYNKNRAFYASMLGHRIEVVK